MISLATSKTLYLHSFRAVIVLLFIMRQNRDHDQAGND